MPQFYSGAATGILETTKLPGTPEMVWQEPQEIHLIDIRKNITVNINDSTHTLEFKQGEVVEPQTSPKWKPHLKYPGPVRNPFWKAKLGARQYSTPMTPRNNNLKSHEMKLT